MKSSVIMEMRRLTARALLDYRKNRGRLAAHALRAQEREDARRWAAAIESARALLRREMPEKERAMARLFGLDAPVPRYQKTRARIIKLCMELHVSESTLYKWREDIVLLTLGAAIEAGILRPFGIRAQDG